MKNHLMTVMNTFSSRVFPIALAALIVSIFSTNLHAGASNKNGNPFGNGSFFSNTGTFSAVVRGSNLSGTVYFSTGVDSNATSTNSSSGSSEIVYEGYTYYGNADGSWSPSSSQISGQISGGQSLSGVQSTTVGSSEPPTSIYITNSTSATNNAVVTNITTTTSVTTTTNVAGDITYSTNTIITSVPSVLQTFSNSTVTNTLLVSSVGQNSFNDVLYMNGSFFGKMDNNYPNQTFSAYGTVIQQQISQQTGGTQSAKVASVTIPIYLSGIRISDTISQFSTIPNTVPYSTTTYSLTTNKY